MNKSALGGVKYWGAATSSHQIEGKSRNQWSRWELGRAAEAAATAEARYADWLPSWEQIKDQAKNPDNYVSGIAVDHYDRYEEDFDLAQQLNLNAYEFSLEWSRIQPDPDKYDEVAIEHYRQVIRALKRRGIEPIVKIWHWTNPVWFEDLGGFSKKGNIKYFQAYAKKVANELHHDVKYMLSINEPNVYAGMSYANGLWPPAEKSWFKTVLVYKNLALAHKQAYKAIKSVEPHLEVGLSQHLTHFYPGNNSIISRWWARLQAYGWNWWFLNRVRKHMDFAGINYYQSNRIIGFKTQNPDEQRNDMGWDMQPADIEHVLKEVYERYNLPVMITENGVADAQDRYRQWWLEQTLAGISRAIESGVPVIGYLHWSLLDNFEWADGFWPRFGLIEVDRETLARRIRPSARWYANLIAEINS